MKPNDTGFATKREAVRIRAVQTTAPQAMGNLAAVHLDLDAARIDALLAGDEQAYLEFVRKIGPGLLRAARALVSTSALAEEVVQEVWLSVLTDLAGFQRRSSLRTWVFGILANRSKALEALEARSVPLSAVVNDHAAFSEDLQGMCVPEAFSLGGERGMCVLERLSQCERARQARLAIEQLPPRERIVVHLRDVEGLGAEDVCRALGVTSANQRVLLHRARVKIRRHLASVERARKR